MTLLDMPQCRIGLALSGGGVRAAAFHAGVLRWFAEKKLLEKIEHVSSVSGGSLFTGLIFQISGCRWPTSAQYLSHVFPNIRDLLIGKSLQFDAILRLVLNPLNWRYILSRANIIAKSIEDLWGISEKLGQLPERPIWSINGTTAENGRRFRFKGTKIGDYEIGYADTKDFKMAAAMAVSAAFPGLVGPLKLNVGKYKWFKRETWDSTKPDEMIIPQFKTLCLYDGGVYDNLGIEPLFDIGKQTIKHNNEINIDFIVVSDAGAPFSRRALPGPLNLKRLKRVADIAFDQTRALRVRSFVNYLKNNPLSGMYLQIGSQPLDSIKKYAQKTEQVTNLQKDHNWLSTEEISSAVSYQTTLRQMKEKDFNILAQHGYETALWNELVFLHNFET